MTQFSEACDLMITAELFVPAAIDRKSLLCYIVCALNAAPSSSGPGRMVLSHEIEGSNPFGATNNEAENYLYGGFPL